MLFIFLCISQLQILQLFVRLATSVKSLITLIILLFKESLSSSTRTYQHSSSYRHCCKWNLFLVKLNIHMLYNVNICFKIHKSVTIRTPKVRWIDYVHLTSKRLHSLNVVLIFFMSYRAHSTTKQFYHFHMVGPLRESLP